MVTVVGFLFRHDHGLFVGLAMAVAIALLDGATWRQRLRHALVYGAIVGALLLPYFAFIEFNGGVVSYFRQASAWAEKDRNRAPVVFPGLFDNPDGVSDAAREGGPLTRAVATVRDNLVAWMFYAEIVLPLLALALIWGSRAACRPTWPHARAKLTMVAVLALALDAFFLRSPLEARLADPSVPLAILVAWLCVALPQVLRPSQWRWPAGAPAWGFAAAALVVAAPVAFTLASGMSWDFHRRLDKAGLTERVGKGFERASGVARQLRDDWRLETWLTRPDRPDLLNLSLYVNACTKPSDRVLMQAYMPQVLAMARRAFAGGHADLRPGFFGTEDAQRLTVSRLERQSVPIILFEADQRVRELPQTVSPGHRLRGRPLSPGGGAPVRRPLRDDAVRAQGPDADRDLRTARLAVLWVGHRAVVRRRARPRQRESPCAPRYCGSSTARPTPVRP